MAPTMLSISSAFCSLVQRLRVQRPEVPLHGGVLGVRLRVALLRVHEVGELRRVAQEEYGRVVAHQVPDALVGVELDGEAARVALGVGRSRFATHGGEAHEQRRFLAHLGEERGAGVAREVARHGELAERARALGVDHSLRDALAVEVRQLLDQVEVFEQQRAARASGQRVLVVGDGHSVGGGQVRLRHGLRSWSGCDGLRMRGRV
jgi:hypothetical protein